MYTANAVMAFILGGILLVSAIVGVISSENKYKGKVGIALLSIAGLVWGAAQLSVGGSCGVIYGDNDVVQVAVFASNLIAALYIIIILYAILIFVAQKET